MIFLCTLYLSCLYPILASTFFSLFSVVWYSVMFLVLFGLISSSFFLNFFLVLSDIMSLVYELFRLVFSSFFILIIIFSSLLDSLKCNVSIRLSTTLIIAFWSMNSTLSEALRWNLLIYELFGFISFLLVVLDSVSAGMFSDHHQIVYLDCLFYLFFIFYLD